MTGSNEIILQARQLTKGFGRGPSRVEVLHGVDLCVHKGEFVAMLGESGCGKSTLLHLLGLMSHPDGGELDILGVQATRAGEGEQTRLRRRALGFVFQRFNLLGVLSAWDNIALSLHVRGLPNGNGRIDQLLARVGLEGLGKRRCQKMSIGQQQRVAVARALAHGPALLLADEPTGNLDSANAHGLLDLFRQANQEGQTIVMITHSAEAAGWADRVLHMKDGKLHNGQVAASWESPLGHAQ